MKRLLFFLLMLVSLAWACKTPRQAENGNTDDGALSPVEFEVLAEGGYSAIEDSLNQLILNESDWKVFWEKINANRMPAPPLPAVNFTESCVVVSCMGSRSSGGYRTLIREIRQEGNSLAVEVMHESPGSNCVASDAITQPYQIVVCRLPGVKKAVFSITKVNRKC